MNRYAVCRLERVLQDQPEIDIAHQRAEATVGEAAQRVSGDEAGAQGSSIGGDCPGQHGLARMGIC